MCLLHCLITIIIILISISSSIRTIIIIITVIIILLTDKVTVVLRLQFVKSPLSKNSLGGETSNF